MPAAERHDELQLAFDAQTSRLLRNRFFWFLGVVAVIYLLARVWVFSSFGGVLLAGVVASSEAMIEQTVADIRLGRAGMWIVLAATLADIAVFASFWTRAARGRLDRRQTTALTLNVLVYLGLTQVLVAVILKTIGFPFVIGLYHLAGCLILPWTALQALAPIALILLANAAALLVFGDMSLGVRVTLMLIGLLAAVPGTLIAWFKHSQRMEAFRVQMLQSRYREIRRELFDARRIHESLFPRSLHQGPLRLDYRYEPMRQIGGDYLYARFSPPDQRGHSALNVLLLDVTGHGIAAALTVNRLHGEIERLFAESPHATPGQLLSALNRYVHLTLANHSIYVTALCARLDCQAGTLEYASAGHPPAFLCRSDESVTRLDSTAYLLGAADGADFDPAPVVLPFGPGDTLLAYTDGAVEARDDHGRMLGVGGLQRSLHVARATTLGLSHRGPGLSAALLAAVEAHRLGPPEDDTLIVEIAFCADSATIPAHGEAANAVASPVGVAADAQAHPRD
jgi:serine phosphatase RsbU (regulator of sigma subunit)